jgi:hypothetical protein
MKFCKKCCAKPCCCAAVRKLKPDLSRRILSPGEKMKASDWSFGWHPIPKEWIGQPVGINKHGLIMRKGPGS